MAKKNKKIQKQLDSQEVTSEAFQKEMLRRGYKLEKHNWESQQKDMEFYNRIMSSLKNREDTK